MKKLRARQIALPALWALTAVFMLLCRAWPWAARLWQRRAALPVARTLHRLTARLPFPALEALAVAAGAAALAGLALSLRQCLAARSSRPLGRSLRRALRGGLALCAVYAALWYPAYWVAPARARTAPAAPELTRVCGELIDALNAELPVFPTPEAALRAAPRAAYLPDCTVKAARLPAWMRAARVVGLYVPWTAEAIADPSAPIALIPFTAVHELMHLRGIADEGEANIAAWRRCMAAGGPFAASARLWALRYAMGLLRRADPEACLAMGAKMEGMLAHTFQQSGGALAPAPAAPILRLIGLSQPAGSYDALVAFLAESRAGGPRP